MTCCLANFTRFLMAVKNLSHHILDYDKLRFVNKSMLFFAYNKIFQLSEMEINWSAEPEF
jgi:hypothetical protein